MAYNWQGKYSWFKRFYFYRFRQRKLRVKAYEYAAGHENVSVIEWHILLDDLKGQDED